MDEKKLNFEKALAQLEKAVKELENGDLTLEESLECFEQGVRMVKLCRKKLDEAEKKVEVLVQGENKENEEG